MNAPVTRRSLLGASTAAVGAVAILGFDSSAFASPASDTGLSTNDARLIAIADELRAVDGRLNALSAVDRGAEKLPEWVDLIDRFAPLEDEIADLPADSMAGVLAKARAALVPPVAGCLNGIADSIAADLVRLHTLGASA